MSTKIGRFRVVKRIGKGRYGIVYRAVDPHRGGQEVALKQVFKEDEEGAVKAHERGAKLQEFLANKDKRVVKIFDIIPFKGDLLISMEDAPGEKLSAPQPLELAIIIAKNIYEVLDKAHDLKGVEGFDAIIHGDLKPENIFIDPQGGIKILDFGSAKELQKSGRLTRGDFGTVAYCSPERIDDGIFEPDVDLWAAGIMLYQMIVGTLPYSQQGLNTERLEQAIRKRSPIYFPEDCNCPKRLKKIIAKILAPDKSRRYRRGAEIVADLDAYRAGHITVAESEEDANPTHRTEPTASLSKTEDETQADKDDETNPTRRTNYPAYNVPPAPPFHTDCEVQPDISKKVISEDFDDTNPTRRTNFGSRKAMPKRSNAANGDLRTATKSTVLSNLIKLVLVVPLLLAVVVGLLFLLNETAVRSEAAQLGEQIQAGLISDPQKAWDVYRQLSERSYFNFGLSPARKPLKDMLITATDRVIADNLTDYPSFGEREYETASLYLTHALELDSGDQAVKARKLYCEAHLDHKIAEMRKKEGKNDEALSMINSAINKFKEAAILRPEWSDPHLGLARVHALSLNDPDNAKKELDEAQRYDHLPAKRDKMFLADAYCARGRSLWNESRKTTDDSTQSDLRTRSKQSFQQGIAIYKIIVPFADALKKLNVAKEAIGRIEQQELEEAPDEAQTTDNQAETEVNSANTKIETANCKIMQLIYARPNLTFKFFSAGRYSYQFETCKGCPDSGEFEISLGEKSFATQTIKVSLKHAFQIRITRDERLVCVKTFGR